MDTFYQALEPIQSLEALHDLSHYVDVPPTWHIALCDVENSTQAIERGQYKAINSVAAACICGCLNAIPNIEIPFAFGGDGASILIPASTKAAIAAVLHQTQVLAQDRFGLHLRIGIIPVQDVLQAGYRLKVAKLSASDNYQQAIFTGGGLSYAEMLLKQPDHDAAYNIVPQAHVPVDFSGYECRWNTIPPHHAEVITLVVAVRAGSISQQHETYRDILRTITMIYGDASQRHPLDLRHLHVNNNPLAYSVESALRTSGNRWWGGIKLMLWSMLGYLRWKFIDKIWHDYKEVVHNSTDHEKFDDVLRMTISGDGEQRHTLEYYLQRKYEQGEVLYGLHVNKASLMTCLVFNRFGRQVHFVDGGDGGYAYAAAKLKQQAALETASTKEHSA